MIGSIYLIQNTVNGKCYVGKTYRNIKQRFKEHLNDSKNRQKYPLYRAFNKYGVDKFTLTLLSNWEEGKLELMEQYYIKMFDSYKTGYNSTLGGEGGSIYDFTEEEIREVINNTFNTRQAAKLLNIKSCTLKKFAIMYNIPLKNEKGGIKYRFSYEEIQNAVLSTKSLTEASKLLKVSETVLHRLSKKYNINLKVDKSNIKGNLKYNFSEEEIKNSIENTSNLKEASLLLGISAATLQKYAKFYKLTIKKGKPSAKINEEIAIRIKYNGEDSKYLSNLFNISEHNIYHIRKGITWKHI